MEARWAEGETWVSSPWVWGSGSQQGVEEAGECGEGRRFLKEGGRLGKGREMHAIWFCIIALFFRHHLPFPVITLDFSILCLLQKLYFQRSITLKKGI